MSSGIKIFFDASLKDNVVGIGIYDFNDQEKYSVIKEKETSSSTEAENFAFEEAIEFAINKYPTVIDFHFFTDSNALYNQIKLLKRKGKTINLHWLPREFNKEADKLSKIDKYTINKIQEERKSKQILTKKEMRKGLVIVKKVEHPVTKIVSVLKTNKRTPIETSLGKYLISEYSLKHRLALIEKIALINSEKLFVKNMYKDNVLLDSSLIEFYSIIYTLLEKRERPNSLRKIYSYPGFKSCVPDYILEKRFRDIFEC